MPQDRGVVVTNRAGLNAITIAAHIVLGMLTISEGSRDVVTAQDRREWLGAEPSRWEFAGSRALVIGFGAIGKLVAKRLKEFGIEVTIVRRSSSGTDGFFGPLQWRDRLREIDCTLLPLPPLPRRQR